MDKEEVHRKLNSVGKTIFVNYFYLFKEYAHGRISKNNCIETLVSNGVSNNAGAAIRTGNAKKIFDTGMESVALYFVVESDRLSQQTIIKAREIRTNINE